MNTKVLYWIISGLIIIILGLGATCIALVLLLVNPDFSKVDNTVVGTELQRCEASGGSWESFASCTDTCYRESSAMRLCTQAISESCYCGVSKCWNGTSCVTDEYPDHNVEPM